MLKSSKAAGNSVVMSDGYNTIYCFIYDIKLNYRLLSPSFDHFFIFSQL